VEIDRSRSSYPPPTTHTTQSCPICYPHECLRNHCGLTIANVIAQTWEGKDFQGNAAYDVTFVLPPGSINGVSSARAKPGDTIILYGVGFGTVTPDSPAGQIVTQANQLAAKFEATFAGTPAKVNFSGLTGGYLGLYQFNVVVPKVAASDAVPFQFSLDGVAGTQTLITALSNCPHYSGFTASNLRSLPSGISTYMKPRDEKILTSSPCFTPSRDFFSATPAYFLSPAWKV
jgi:hypothetical protein